MPEEFVGIHVLFYVHSWVHEKLALIDSLQQAHNCTWIVDSRRALPLRLLLNSIVLTLVSGTLLRADHRVCTNNAKHLNSIIPNTLQHVTTRSIEGSDESS